MATFRAPLGEAALAARWAAGAWRGQPLLAANGEHFRLVYEGRPGGGPGPDFRDAVVTSDDGSRLLGDIELHLRASAWRAHGHADDARYNRLVLHIVLRAPRDAPSLATRLASGARVPLVALGALPGAAPGAAPGASSAPPWPCAGLAARLGNHALRERLVALGMTRFERRADGLRAALEAPAGAGLWSPEGRVLWVALAEALGYGRDRMALRLVGERLACGDPPEDVCSGDGLGRIEALRLRGLLALRARWLVMGPLEPLVAALLAGSTPRGASQGLVALLMVPGGAISPGRAVIVAANVVLPFCAALAAWRGDARLAVRARAVYGALGAPPSNAITRLLARQLGMPRLPVGAAAHLGLHELWANACRAKACARCPLMSAISRAACC